MGSLISVSEGPTYRKKRGLISVSGRLKHSRWELKKIVDKKLRTGREKYKRVFIKFMI
jgi:hypothetical protein